MSLSSASLVPPLAAIRASFARYRVLLLIPRAARYVAAAFSSPFDACTGATIAVVRRRLPPNASKERKYVTDVSLTSTRSRDHQLAERYLTRSQRLRVKISVPRLAWDCQVVVMMPDVGKVELPYCLRPMKEQTLDQCTNLDYALEMWRLLDPEAHLISLKQLMDRVLYNVLKKRFVMPRRLLMTGTPIQNNLSELWALMHLCAPLVFGKLEQFLFTFREAAGTSVCHLNRVAPLVPLQKKVYLSILRRELPMLLAFSSKAPNHQSLQNIVMQLRKTCSHPYLFPGIEPEPYVEGEHLVQAVPPYELPALTKGYLFPLDYKLARPPSVALSVGDWFFDRVGVSAIDCPYPCDNTCHYLVSK
ncbi:hypothetical protein Scep_012674 [Stephania cephalantha]|uniref:SNF2 N-terminal domain-containing protein n=1 Tax=Stephania cephalantha TaxID=152367 RepID=A0AAP0JFD3_9MAGN